MSHSLNGNKIKLTRGDTLRLRVDIKIDGEVYTPQLGDKVRFALKRSAMSSDRSRFMDNTPLIKKDIPINTMILELEPKDTKNLGFGKYVYDVQITFADGTVDTFITKETFEITEEVD